MDTGCIPPTVNFFQYTSFLAPKGKLLRAAFLGPASRRFLAREKVAILSRFFFGYFFSHLVGSFGLILS
ncbi:hypothetical protein PGIN_AFR-5B1_00910 [Porphyromonas gingivalis]|nr:hypothetical protein PGIN_AFR-5B1_00910 [Porphyromonas gingivalis]